jgi:putative transposase
VLNPESFQQLITLLGCPLEATKLIQQVRSTPPSRAVSAGRANVKGRYASRKMGVTVQFESHKVELPIIHELEHDEIVREYYDQPPPIKLEYHGSDGKPRAHFHTPDFFVLGQNGIGWQECKTEDELLRLEERNSNLYRRNENGEWIAPAGQNYAAKFKFYYRVRCATLINWIFQRNISFLDDYYRADVPSVTETSRIALGNLVRSTPGIFLSDLLTASASFATSDDVYFLIATDVIYADLYAAALSKPDTVRVYANKEIAEGHALTVERPPKSCDEAARPQFVEPRIGSSIQWNGNTFQILNVGNGGVSLLSSSKNFLELPWTAFEDLVREGKVTRVESGSESTTYPYVTECFATASEAELAAANRRCRIVRAFLSENVTPEDTVISPRTLRRYVKSYREAEERYGYGYVGLIPRTNRRGCRRRKLPDLTLTKMKQFIQTDYATLKQKRMFEVYSAFLASCLSEDVTPASYKTFTKEVKASGIYEQTLSRKGSRAAYEHKPFYWLESNTPRHGERPFELCHMDHTQLDVECADSETGQPMGRPWLSILIDAFSRRFLSLYLTFDRPSYRSCMMLIREGVRRYGRFPQTIVVDGGAEFQSTYFETLVARYDGTLKFRPPAQARFGSVCERLFNTTNTRFIHNLRGNTQIMKNVRQVTKAVNPKSHVTWSLKELYSRLCHYCYEVYDNIEHSTLGLSPRNAFELALAKGGGRLHRIIPYDDDFLIATLPTTSKGTAKVQPGRGIKVNGILYWSDCFRNPLIETSQVQVRFDPWNIGVVYAFISNRWVESHSEFYSVFRGRSEKELMIATTELRKRLSRTTTKSTITAKRVAEFLQLVESEEVLLIQRQRDREQRLLGQSAFGNPIGGVANDINLSGENDESLTSESDLVPEQHEYTPETYEEYF